MVTPREIIDLVERFGEHCSYYEKYYSCDSIRNEFVSPLFEALGWDVHNRDGKPPYMKDVFFNKSQRTMKMEIFSPDYTFYIDGDSRFFVKVIDPSKNIEDKNIFVRNIYEQGHDLGFHLSIITNFKEFAIYDTRNPLQEDEDIYKTKYYQYEDFVDKWDQISKYLSRDAVDNNEHLNLLSEEI